MFRYAPEFLGIPVGTIRATVLIETIPAAFEMEEILFGEHASGLNAGRWDYPFSIIRRCGMQVLNSCSRIGIQQYGSPRFNDARQLFEQVAPADDSLTS